MLLFIFKTWLSHQSRYLAKNMSVCTHSLLSTDYFSYRWMSYWRFALRSIPKIISREPGTLPLEYCTASTMQILPEQPGKGQGVPFTALSVSKLHFYQSSSLEKQNTTQTFHMISKRDAPTICKIMLNLAWSWGHIAQPWIGYLGIQSDSLKSYYILKFIWVRYLCKSRFFAVYLFIFMYKNA